MKIVVAHPLFRPFEPVLRELLGPAHVIRFSIAAECAGGGGDFSDTEVLVTSRFASEWSAHFPKLRLLHAAGAGIDKIDIAAIPAGARLCRTLGHGPSIAEHVIMVMLALQRGLLAADRALREGHWRCSQFDPGITLPFTLAGRTVVILGTGDIGIATARACRGFGMACIGLNRSGRTPTGGVFDRCMALESLDEALPLADILVIALPLEENTRGMIDARRLARLRPGAYLINVARAQIADEEALFAALQSRALAGAALDVWYAYPAAGRRDGEPAHLPFGSLDNVILTPHMSGVTRHTFRHRAADIAHNVLALESGAPLRNEIPVGPRADFRDPLP